MTGPSPIQDAVRRHRLAEVARRTGIPLHTDTGTVTVRCPLPSHRHPDRTPSLRLYLDDDRYYCFGCAAKGDVIQWARDTQGVGVRDAIRALDSGTSLTNAWTGATSATAGSGRLGWAGDSASPPPRSDGGPEALDPGRTPPERVLSALAAAWDYYTSPPRHAQAVAYLAGRSIQVAVLEAHTDRPETGHTPIRPDELTAALRAKGFSGNELVDAGLAHRRQDSGQLHDFYRHRVLIPVRDDQQRVVGIIGRNIGDQQHWAKYKNPPRTAIYDKSVNLYQPLPPPTDPHGQVIVVEGTLDALAIAVAAIRTGQPDRYCPVTQSGRELSAVQLSQILAMHPTEPVLGFDGDTAGRNSVTRYARAFGALGRYATVATLPAAHDPASWLAAHGDIGLDAWRSENATRPGRGRSVQLAGVTHRGGIRAATMAPDLSTHSPGARYLIGETPAVATGPDDGLAMP